MNTENTPPPITPDDQPEQSSAEATTAEATALADAPHRKKTTRRLMLFQGDAPLWIVIMLLLTVSVMVVWSSTISLVYKEAGGNTSHFLTQHLIHIAVGVTAMVFIHFIDFRKLAKWTPLLFLLALSLVIWAMLFGVSRNEAARWVEMPIFKSFQPSEALKISLIMLLATQLGARSTIINNIPIIPALNFFHKDYNKRKNLHIFKYTTVPIVVPILAASAAVFPTNLSTAMILFATSMLILLIAQVRFSQVFKLSMVTGITAVFAVIIMITFGIGRSGAWKGRIDSFTGPVVALFSDSSEDQNASTNDKPAPEDDKEFQLTRAKMAMASGGLLGKGPGNSTLRTSLPHPYSDFTYAFVIEEYGILGAIGILLLYLWFLHRCVVIMRQSRSTTNSILVISLAISITIQAMINMMVCVGLVPVTGQQLPLISKGGSSMLFACISMGLILGVSRRNQLDAAEAERQLRAESALARQQPDTDTDGAGEETIQRDLSSEQQSDEKTVKKTFGNQTDTDEDDFTVTDYTNDNQATASANQRETIDLE